MLTQQEFISLSPPVLAIAISRGKKVKLLSLLRTWKAINDRKEFLEKIKIIISAVDTFWYPTVRYLNDKIPDMAVELLGYILDSERLLKWSDITPDLWRVVDNIDIIHYLLSRTTVTHLNLKSLNFKRVHELKYALGSGLKLNPVWGDDFPSEQERVNHIILGIDMYTDDKRPEPFNDFEKVEQLIIHANNYVGIWSSFREIASKYPVTFLLNKFAIALSAGWVILVNWDALEFYEWHNYFSQIVDLFENHGCKYMIDDIKENHQKINSEAVSPKAMKQYQIYQEYKRGLRVVDPLHI